MIVVLVLEVTQEKRLLSLDYTLVTHVDSLFFFFSSFFFFFLLKGEELPVCKPYATSCLLLNALFFAFSF